MSFQLFSVEASRAVLILVGPFDFHDGPAFRECYSTLLDKPEIRTITLAFDQVPRLDSSALGALFALYARARVVDKHVELTGVTGQVKRILDIANLTTLCRTRSA